jgi:hypothetical protein
MSWFPIENDPGNADFCPVRSPSLPVYDLELTPNSAALFYFCTDTKVLLTSSNVYHV